MRGARVGFGAAGIAAATLLLSACGTGGIASGQGDQTNGQKLFSQTCASCHTLAAANAHGTVGPSLDASFAADRAQGFKDSSIENVVLDQIRLGSGPIQAGGGPGSTGKTQEEPTMPANLLTGKDAVDVAAYVASVAGQNGAEAQSPAQLGTDGKKIFTTECGSCHTLKAAGTTGTVGPNLDQLKPAFPIAQHQVTVGGGVMPAFKGTLSQAQIDAVAHYVADNAGK